MNSVDKLRKEQNDHAKYFDSEGNFIDTNNLERATKTLDIKEALAAKLFGREIEAKQEKVRAELSALDNSKKLPWQIKLQEVMDKMKSK